MYTHMCMIFCGFVVLFIKLCEIYVMYEPICARIASLTLGNHFAQVTVK